MNIAQVEAVYQNGVLKLLTPVALAENQKVTVEIRSEDLCVSPNSLTAAQKSGSARIFRNPNALQVDKWLERSKQLHEEFVAKHGVLPDSTPDIAVDRMRDA